MKHAKSMLTDKPKRTNALKHPNEFFQTQKVLYHNNNFTKKKLNQILIYFTPADLQQKLVIQYIIVEKDNRWRKRDDR